MTHHTYSHIAENNKEAERIFNKAGMRLLNSNFWCKVFDNAAPCRLFNKNGNEVNRLIKKNDFFRLGYKIDEVTNPEVFEWVSVENIESYTDSSLEMELFTVIVKPAPYPFVEGESNKEHFSRTDVNTALSIKRESGKVTIELHKSMTPLSSSEGRSKAGAHRKLPVYTVPAKTWEKIIAELFS